MKCVSLQEDAFVLRRAHAPEIFRGERRALTIDSVAGDRVANVTQVDSNLVSAAGFQPAFKFACNAPRIDCPVMRHGMFAARRVGVENRHFLAVAIRPAQPRVDGAVGRLRAARADRDIAPRCLFLCREGRQTQKIALPQSRDGVVQILLDNDDDTLVELRRPDSEVYLG